MFDSLLDDGLTPKFVFLSPVFLDELDAHGRLSSERLAAHVQTAVDEFHSRTGEELNVVRDLRIEFLDPVRAAGELRIDVWLDAIDATTCTYGFTCSSADGRIAHGRGEQTVTMLDPIRRRPSTWSEAFLQKQSTLVKALHNYA
jgi:acyl-CoA thioesterase FadM